MSGRDKPIRRGAAAPGRRRAIAILGASAALAAGGLAWRTAAPPPVVRWRGIALGAWAEITVAHEDAGRARRALALARAEIARLESIFSLFRPESELVRLNRDGHLDAPSHDLVALIAESQHLGALTGGAFDITVQPLWRALATHYTAASGAPGAAPPACLIERALRSVDYRAIEVGAGRIAFARPAMAATLNGIAQGAITDRVALLLREAGLESVLVDLGEFRALGRPSRERAWRIGLDAPGAAKPWRTVALAEGALATSAGAGLPFEPSGRHHHILDPRSGASPMRHASVSVFAPRAAVADALATALLVAPWRDAPRLLASAGATRALALGTDGRVREAVARG